MRFVATTWDAGHWLRQQAGLTCAPTRQMGAMLTASRLLKGQSEDEGVAQVGLSCSWWACGTQGTASLSSKPGPLASGFGLPMRGSL